MRPKDKFDIKACKKLKECNDEELIEMGEWLSGWLGDANFPIFSEIVEIFVERQDTLLPFVSNIFYSMIVYAFIGFYLNFIQNYPIKTK